jgi:hypothetical protein
MEQNAIGAMSQQSETNSNHNVVNQTDNEQCGDRTQIPFPSHYSSSRQTSEFLLCKSCFWCSSSIISSSEGSNITTCPSCNDTRLVSMPISDKFGDHPKSGDIQSYI